MAQDAAEQRPRVIVRRATIDDVPAITRIYNQGIVDRVATLETDERDEDERRSWLASRGERHPVLVACRDRQIVGWGSLNSFNPRPVYRHVADLSVYVERDARGTGVGSTLLAALIAEGRRLAYHKVVLAAFPTNVAGVRLYQRHGFREVGVYREQGRLDGRWVDTVVMELLLELPGIPDQVEGITVESGSGREAGHPSAEASNCRS